MFLSPIRVVWLGNEEKQTTFIAHLSVKVCELLQMFSTVTVPSSFLHVFFITLLTLEFHFFVVTSPPFLPMLGSLPVCPFLFLLRITFFGKFYLFFWMNFYHRCSKWMCLWGFRSDHKVYDICNIFGCHSKKRWRRKQKRLFWALPSIPEVGEHVNIQWERF